MKEKMPYVKPASATEILESLNISPRILKETLIVLGEDPKQSELYRKYREMRDKKS